uniref:Uncharacterized protein n=1 Tax=Aegilops tauschii subsp. strangulata TaxID=200361 RepID=A0A452XRD8_AEGTS
AIIRTNARRSQPNPNHNRSNPLSRKKIKKSFQSPSSAIASGASDLLPSPPPSSIPSPPPPVLGKYPDPPSPLPSSPAACC